MAASEHETAEGASSEGSRPTKPGPPNPQGSGDVDVPSPPGGPLRSDTPSGTVPPGGPGTPGMPGEPHEVKRAERPVHEPGTSEEATEVLMGEDNAQSSQREPSDDSGSE
jgi:hypothetical protein